VRGNNRAKDIPEFRGIAAMAAKPMDDSFQCCFCGSEIEPIAPDPIHLEIPLQDGATQAIYTHAACLRRLLHPSVALHPKLWE
jgi:hypothetical protein